MSNTLAAPKMQPKSRSAGLNSCTWLLKRNADNLAGKIRRTLLVGALLVSPTISLALSFSDAGQNLLYFEHAQLASAYCEGRGHAVGSVYLEWATANADLRIESENAIRRRAAEGGFAKPEQEIFLNEAKNNQREVAREHITKKGVICEKFAQAMQMYTSLLKR